MSLDINWSLLLSDPSPLDFSTILINLLNRQLSSPSLSRPSFIGPIQIVDLKFGTTGPYVEIRDIRDVCRAFEDDSSPLLSPINGRINHERIPPLDVMDHHGEGMIGQKKIISGLDGEESHDHHHHQHHHTSPTTSPPPSPPTHPLPSPPTSLPSLQLHLHLHHNSDLVLTLQTSLQVNYPSLGFMSLPLKLSIVGFTLDADVVLAFSSEKNRVHVCIVDEDIDIVGLSQKILPSLIIESEIGDKDSHVLRNVGKVERFISDVVRKTLVEELVWPNFHSIQL
ncbi:hypothetical protein TREMEDRAFT_31766 [Tremella mesenterica DSM 1558]|uniref:uncharacterized protein n=1 Tax=Tremella mesenterica (strain ATCC 24925 / CBS 8224 / DSM 1558 / NBRC 9311 / NRRL Y-6157 / RJB 2259-6 / UBC 559-6) TaxID=578456 RepID=UPI0003F49D72|nr:uncharacterized protein TREMEDRAFT_31766 [Tremella mesenterica DSM 1558]EIW68599.1 hypothetical protein TREMEDRAFT_31766 [Tremella mesenterica DSM 1558]